MLERKHGLGDLNCFESESNLEKLNLKVEETQQISGSCNKTELRTHTYPIKILNLYEGLCSTQHSLKISLILHFLKMLIIVRIVLKAAVV